MYSLFNCPSCLKEIPLEVDMSDNIVYGGDECENCGYVLSEKEKMEIYDLALRDCASVLTDAAFHRQER